VARNCRWAGHPWRYAVWLCKVTQEPTSQLAALLRAAQIVYILSIGALIITTVNSMACFHSTNWLMKWVTSQRWLAQSLSIPADILYLSCAACRHCTTASSLQTLYHPQQIQRACKQVELDVKCLSLMSDFKQNWNLSINFNKRSQYTVPWKSVSCSHVVYNEHINEQSDFDKHSVRKQPHLKNANTVFSVGWCFNSFISYANFLPWRRRR
jgi:hypothetical protein